MGFIRSKSLNQIAFRIQKSIKLRNTSSLRPNKIFNLSFPMFNKVSNAPTKDKTFDQQAMNRLYDEVINEQPEEQSFNQDLSTSNINISTRQKKNKLQYKQSVNILQDNSGNSFSNLTKSQKNLQIQKIYSQSKINSFIFQIRKIIFKSKQEITDFSNTNVNRQTQLKVYNKKLDQLDAFLKDTLGSSDQIKIFTVKKVMMILKSAGKIKSIDQYNKLIRQVDQIGGIQQIPRKAKQSEEYLLIQNQENDSQLQENIKIIEKTNLTESKNMTRNPQMIYHRQRRSATLDGSFMMSQKKYFRKTFQAKNIPATSDNNVEDDVQFQKILEKVDEIHENHIKTWQKHTEQFKEFQERQRQIKIKYSSFHSKMFTNRRIQQRHSSLNQIASSKSNDLRQGKLLSFQPKQRNQTQQPDDSRRLSSSLSYLTNGLHKKAMKNQNQIRLKLEPIYKNKKLQSPLRTRPQSKLSLSKRSMADKKSKSKENKESIKKSKIMQSKQNSSLQNQRKRALLKPLTQNQKIKSNSVQKNKQKDMKQNQSRFSKPSNGIINLSMSGTNTRKLKLTL